jgi:hypothetical protein
MKNSFNLPDEHEVCVPSSLGQSLVGVLALFDALVAIDYYSRLSKIVLPFDCLLGSC